MHPTDHVITAQGLVKRYRDTCALDGFDLTVPAGTVCGLLGPNGAGKTTAVRVLSTLQRADAGRATVAGYDVARQADRVRARIGLVGQQTALDEALTGQQNLRMFARLCHLPPRDAHRRAWELLEHFGLADAADKPVRHYSGGMRRRLDLAAGLVTDPAVLFLDEPTTGLDPRGRAEVWQAVRALVERGTTVLLTTQYLEEADQLAHRIAVVDTGRVIAEGTPGELKTALGGDHLDIVLRDAADLDTAARLVHDATRTPPRTDPDARQVSVPVHDRVRALTTVTRALEEAGLDAADITLRRPTLDEVFLHLTGRPTPTENRRQEAAA